MNSVERFNSILDFKKPDRMPLYIPAVACSVASGILGREAHTGGDSLHFKEEYSWTQGAAAHNEFVCKYREDTIALADALGVDVVREAWRCTGRPAKKLDEYTLLFGDENGRHTVKRFFPETQSYGTVKSNEGYCDIEELVQQMKAGLRHDFNATDDGLFEQYADQLEIMRLAGGRFAVLASALSVHLPIEDSIWLEATALEPELLRDYYLNMAQGLAKHARWFREKGFRFINAGSDIASKDGPIISPGAFSFIVEPAIQVIASACADLGLTYCYRSDGNLWSLCDSIFIKAGVHAYGEVDRNATMTVAGLREKYPETIILGNVSSITLGNGTERQVREETRATLAESGGYGYIAGPSNAIVHGTPIKNVYAMIDEIVKYKP